MLTQHVARRPLAALVAGAWLATVAGAQQTQTQTDDFVVPMMTPAYAEPGSLMKFDPARGELKSIRIDATANGRALLEVENLSPNAGNVSIANDVPLLLLQGPTRILSLNVQASFSANLPGFDGTNDFRGASGRTVGPINTTDADSFIVPPANFDMFIQQGDMPEFVDFSVVAANGTCTGTGPGNVASACTATVGATVRITYTFNPDQDCPKINRRRCASLLLFPEFDNRHGIRTVATVTNKNSTDDVCVHYIYVGRKDREGRDLNCEEFDRFECLTPNDTLTVMTNNHNPQQEQGFFYVYAVEEDTHEAIIANDLIGHLLVVDGLDAFEYAVNPVDYRAIVGPDEERGDPTDKDDDGIRDLNGLEYEQTPSEILIPRFLGQGDRMNSRLIFIGLSGGAQFTTTADLLLYNDDEQVFSANHTFRCWDKVRLVNITQAFKNDFLKTTDDDSDEKLGPFEYGWIRIKGRNAHAGFKDILDPAIYAVLIEIVNQYAAADLPFELCHNKNGHLFPRTLSGDNEE